MNFAKAKIASVIQKVCESVIMYKIFGKLKFFYLAVVVVLKFWFLAAAGNSVFFQMHSGVFFQ